MPKNAISNLVETETQEFLDKKVQELREVIKESKEKDLINVDFKDDLLIKFLRARNFDIQSCFELLKTWMETKSTNKHVFVLPSKLKIAFDNNIICALPKKSKKNEEILYMKIGHWNPSLFTCEMVQAATLVSYEKVALDESGQKNGIVGVLDMASFGWKQLRHFGPFQAKTTAFLIEKVAPIKLNAIHIINQSRFTDIAYVIIKPFLSENLKKKIHFYGSNYTEFYKVIDQSNLPEDIGGGAGPFKSTQLYEKLLEIEKDLEKLWSL